MTPSADRDARLALLSPAVARVRDQHRDRPPLLGPSTGLPTADELRTALRRAFNDAAEDERFDEDSGAAHALRRVKYECVARCILYDDAHGPSAVDAVTATISALADALVDGALSHARTRLERRHGAPERWGTGGIAVLALGKHGAGELNYSSDIDVVFVASDLDGMTAPGPEGGRSIECRRFADRLVAAVSNLLSSPTQDGFCFRVDLDLRPEGQSAPAICTVAAAEEHFLLWGRTWERAAWLRARSCAGDINLGEQLLQRLQPFLWRRAMDFHTLDEIAAMRDRIAFSAKAVERDLKKGPGGIREVEFLVQAAQLVRGGREPALRVRGTVEAAHRLAAASALPVEPGPLLDAWRVLRAVEHRLQWPEEAQTQRLPEDDDHQGWTGLASRCSWVEGEPGLRRALADARRVVAEAWAMMRVGPQRQEPSASQPAREHHPVPPVPARALFDPFLPSDERVAILAALGFPDPSAAANRLRDADRGSGPRLSPGTQRRFERVMPQLLSLAAREEEPADVLDRLLDFVRGAGGRGTVWALLEENPRAAETLVRLFGASPLLGATFVRHPELLDALVLRGRGGDVPPREAEVLLADLDASHPVSGVEEDDLAALRTWQTVELLRIGLCDLSHSLPAAPGDRPGEAPLPHRWLSDVARTCVQRTTQLATELLIARHGALLDSDGAMVPMAVVGMGSLGSGWLTYGSDLDLILVHGDGARGSEGPQRPIDPTTWCARWGQRLLSILSVQTAEGRCYEVDLRLRPDGPAGPVATTLSAFGAYLRDGAKPWERIASCRARVVAATDPTFGATVDAAIVQARHLGPGWAATLHGESARMRALQRTELGPNPSPVARIKRSSGGLADLEFTIACAQLCAKEGSRASAQADPLRALDALTEDGLDERAATAVRGAFRHLRQVESQARLRGRPWATAHADIESALEEGRTALALWPGQAGVNQG